MAVITFADIEIEPHPSPEGEEGLTSREQVRTTVDAFRFVHTEEMHDINHRAPELERLLDDGLSVALAEMMKKL